MTEDSKLTICNTVVAAAAGALGGEVSYQGRSKGDDDEENKTTDDDDVNADEDGVGNKDDNTAGDENVDDEGKANGRFSILLFNSLDARRIDEVVGGDNGGKRWFG